MGEDFKHIDQLFRDKLEGHRETPPAYVKERLDKDLDTLIPYAETINAPAKRNHRWLAAAVLLLLLSGTVTLIVRNSGSGIKQFAGTDQSQPARQRAAAESNSITGSNNLAEQPENKGKPSKNNNVSQPGGIQKVDQRHKLKSVIAGNQTSGMHKNSEGPADDKNELVIVPAVIQEQAASLPQAAAEDNHSTFTQGNMETAYRLPDLSVSAPQQIGMPAVKTLAKADVPEQVSKPKITARKGFSFTAFYAPERSTSYMYQNFAQHRDERKEEIRRTEDDAYTYSAGLLASYDLNSRWTIESGLLYSAHSTTIHPKFFFARPDDDGVVKFKFNFSSGYGFIKPKMPSSQPIAAGDSLQSISSENVLHYVGIPLAVKYNFKIGRLSLFTRTGVSIRILTDQSTETTYFNGFVKENSKIGHIKGLRPSYFTGIVSAGAEYSIGKHWAVTFFPSFNFALTPINKDAPVKTYVSTLGFVSGIKFKL
ncbi:outer membrane beta-barrel protein [Sediminibacterium ginsengisoli]|uniref:Outer membrane protein beta-barrel domain-containing protein n=1 Tax=Sediminibacterium ginsengisoli TaxID=413434 RepID=A0A1T4KC30_9BACT|nr:outer membrane beta-barrel protein [Sediminibacterium ginsengisoli]SJZ39979.1 Outer membrane protein beta-barrel domain-containing protein [Sediminibacterium ginsengisoli]